MGVCGGQLVFYDLENKLDSSVKCMLFWICTHFIRTLPKLKQHAIMLLQQNYNDLGV